MIRRNLALLKFASLNLVGLAPKDRRGEAANVLAQLGPNDFADLQLGDTELKEFTAELTRVQELVKARIRCLYEAQTEHPQDYGAAVVG